MQMGFAYIVSVVSLFDEYVNDLLYLREGSCIPRCHQIYFNVVTCYSHQVHFQEKLVVHQ